ncbi:MAG TPA: shikimate dehydrogenase [Clostridiaceae bacterium]|nr:shikimate dehydrogenase [Clostridiaceae bacterium]
MHEASIDARVTGKTRIMGVLGNPVEHSISPQIHNTISNLLGVNAIYIPLKSNINNLEDTIKGLKAINVAGFNITIPFKEKVMQYLDECSQEARLIGAVNTVVNKNGRLIGYNTDAEGFSKSFEEAFGKSFKSARIMVLGAGGAARAVAVKAAMQGADTINIVNRTSWKAAEIASLINNHFECKAEAVGFENIKQRNLLEKTDVIINTTPIGMYPDIDNSPVSVENNFSEKHIVYDLIYNPPETKLLKHAKKCGARTLNGLGMLLRQAILAYELITGISVPDDVSSTVITLFENYFFN